MRNFFTSSNPKKEKFLLNHNQSQLTVCAPHVMVDEKASPNPLSIIHIIDTWVQHPLQNYDGNYAESFPHTQLDMMSFLWVKDIWMWFIFQQVNTIIYFPRSLHLTLLQSASFTPLNTTIKFSFFSLLRHNCHRRRRRRL